MKFQTTLLTPPSEKRTDAPNYFIWVDFLRGLASISILIWHYHHFYYTSADANSLTDPSIQPFYRLFSVFYNYGGAAVQLFWTISGFVFANVYLNARTVTAKGYFVRRFARLYPLHFVTLLIVAALQFLSNKAFGHYQIYSINNVYHFLLNLSFTSGWGLEDGYSFNAPIWSVSVEVFIYIIFFLSIPYVAKKPFLAIGLILLFLPLWILRVPGWLFWQCGAYFYIGCFVYYLWKTLDVYKRAIPLLVGSILATLSVLIYYTLDRLGLESGYAIFLLNLTLFPSLVLVASSIDRFDLIGLGSKVRFIGDMTYGLYLWHIPFQIITLMIFAEFALSRDIVSSELFFLFYISSIFGISYVSYRYFELPMRLFIRRRFSTKTRET